MIVLGKKLPLINHRDTWLQLYPHQAVMLEEWDKHKTFLLVTRTGTGKTIGAVMPLLKRKQRAILVYPTNELIRDQVASIGRIAELEGLKACVLAPQTPKEAFARADVVLVHIDAAALAEWDKKLHLGGLEISAGSGQTRQADSYKPGYPVSPLCPSIPGRTPGSPPGV